MPTNTYYKLTGTKVRETDKAILFRPETIDTAPCEKDPDGKYTSYWFPLSQIKSIVTTPHEGADTIEVAEWILSAKGLI